MSTPPYFSTMFQRETIFTTSCLITCRTKSSKNRVYSLRKEFAPMGANSFLFEMTRIFMGGNNKNDKVASPESVPIHLYSICIFGTHLCCIVKSNCSILRHNYGKYLGVPVFRFLTFLRKNLPFKSSCLFFSFFFFGSSLISDYFDISAVLSEHF